MTMPGRSAAQSGTSSITQVSTRDDIPGWMTWPTGTRVVVRRWLTPAEAQDSGHTVTDIIGILLEAGPSGLLVRRDTAAVPSDEPAIRVSADLVVAVKKVPPRPARRSTG